MIETIGLYALAALLGFLAARGLSFVHPKARWGGRGLRAALLLLTPLAALFAVFLVFTKGNPRGDEWIWLGVGVAYFWPWYLAWLTGCSLDSLLRRFARSQG
ncbi:MAG: hypothetical protein AAF127_11625 [Pseudomonadota bacterium]